MQILFLILVYFKNSKEKPKKMGKSLEFIHFVATSYRCSPCKQKFVCKKTESKKDKEKREKQFEESGYSICFLCNERYWRCKDDKCTNCCNLNKCNDIVC